MYQRHTNLRCLCVLKNTGVIHGLQESKLPQVILLTEIDGFIYGVKWKSELESSDE